MSKFSFGNTSKKRLEGIHPHLVKVFERAIELSEIDFTITEGLRSKQTQQEYYNAGKSKTINGSRHLEGSDGYGHAVDVVAHGVPSVWDFNHYYKIAEAVQKASKELNIPIRWGGAWHYRLNEEDATPEELTEKYKRTQKETGKKSFLDGVHFELPNNGQYPQ